MSGRAAMAEAFLTPTALDVLAHACVAVHGTPHDLMEGAPIT